MLEHIFQSCQGAFVMRFVVFSLEVNVEYSRCMLETEKLCFVGCYIEALLLVFLLGVRDLNTLILHCLY